jgi:hypothetical protein
MKVEQGETVEAENDNELTEGARPHLRLGIQMIARARVEMENFSGKGTSG